MDETLSIRQYIPPAWSKGKLGGGLGGNKTSILMVGGDPVIQIPKQRTDIVVAYLVEIL